MVQSLVENALELLRRAAEGVNTNYASISMSGIPAEYFLDAAKAGYKVRVARSRDGGSEWLTFDVTEAGEYGRRFCVAFYSVHRSKTLGPNGYSDLTNEELAAWVKAATPQKELVG